jgi:hypothetical protein
MADQNIKVNINLDLTEFNKNAKAMSDALSKVLGKDVRMFSDEMKKAETSINGAEKALGNAGKAASSTGNTVKQSNIQWHNLALVIQDLPFGFRAIQNNLPALASSLAGVAGPAYLAFSALVAAITAYDMGIFGAKKSTDEFTSSLKKTNEELSKTVNYTNSDSKNLESLLRVGLNLNNSEQVRLNALKDIKKVLGQVNKEEADKIKTIEGAIIPVQLYTEALKKQQLQEYASGKIAELQIGLVEKRDALDIARRGGERSISILKLFGIDSIDELRNQVVQAETEIRFLEDILDQANKKTFVNPFDKSNKEEKPDDSAIKQQNAVNEKVLQDLINAKRQELEIYKDDAFKKYEVSKELATLEQRLGVLKVENGGFNAAQSAKLIEGINREHANQLIIIDQQMQEQLLLQDAKTRKAKKKRIAEENKEAAYFIEQRIKAAQTEADASIKANRGNYQAQKAALEEVISKLVIFKAAGIGGAEGMLKLDEAITNNVAKIEGLVDPLETLNQSFQNLMNQLQVDLLVNFGEQLGEMIAGGKFDFSKLGTILADALSSLGKALITFALTTGATLELFKDPKKWGLALAAGVAAVAAGSALKSTLKNNQTTAFANGGIVSGPTMGLVGEYPGAQNNPEVIAPLDKLKSMIGGGGNGTFVLRGQDLLLSINRAQKASNLKGQNISLA